MSVIRALLFSYWLLVALPNGTKAAAIAASPVDSDNSTVQAEEGSSELEPWSDLNSTNTSAMCHEVKKIEQEEEQMRVRLSNIKAQIMAKFGLTEPPPNPAPMNLSDIMDERTMTTYYELLNRQAASEAESTGKIDECGRIKGKKSSFYANELRVHFPSSFSPVVPSVYMFEWGKLAYACAYTMHVAILLYSSVCVFSTCGDN